jgi:hypothetical protein
MIAFVKKNERLLKFHYNIARIVGLVLLVCGASWGVLSVTKAFPKSWGWKDLEDALHSGPLQTGNCIFFGLILLMVAQFIRYLFDTEYQPSWLLRHGEKFLYAYAFFVFVHTIWYYVWFYKGGQVSFLAMGPALAIGNALTTGPLRMFRVLISFGAGQILRRILPAIKESRALV